MAERDKLQIPVFLEQKFFRLAIVPVQREVESGCSLAASRASLDDTAPMYWLVGKARC